MLIQLADRASLAAAAFRRGSMHCLGRSQGRDVEQIVIGMKYSNYSDVIICHTHVFWRCSVIFIFNYCNYMYTYNQYNHVYIYICVCVSVCVLVITNSR